MKSPHALPPRASSSRPSRDRPTPIGRVRDAFAVYGQIHPGVGVTDEAFRKAMGRAADVLLYLFQQWSCPLRL